MIEIPPIASVYMRVTKLHSAHIGCCKTGPYECKEEDYIEVIEVSKA